MRPFNPLEDEEQLNQIPPAPAAPVKLPGMPPSVTPQDLEGYLGQQKQSLNKYGPEVQMDLQKKTLADRNSLGSRATSGLKGFADALMQGVAGAGNPGWQQGYENQQDQRAKEQMDTLRNADEGNLRRTSTNMNIDRMSANSPLSKSAQSSKIPLLEMMGIPAEKASGMSAADIDNTVSLMAQYGSAQQQALIKKYEADMASTGRAAQLEQQGAHDKEMENIAREKSRQDAAEGLLRTDRDSKWYNPLTWGKGISSEQKEAARGALMDQIDSIPKFESEEEAAKAGLQDGTPVVIGGVRGKWRNQ